ncbi:MAG: hypothetical protein ACOYD0_10980 [Candidatus Nanopelagicales bacterium]
MPRPRRWLIPLWSALLTVLALGPALVPGYTLSYDMVFVPRQTLLPWMLGVSGGLPRSTPQDIVVALIAGPVPGQILQKVALVAALLLAGIGTARLLRGTHMLIQFAAATLAIWNPFVAERLVLGNWAVLLTYGAMPWIVAVVMKARRGELPGCAQLVLWCGLGSLVPTGGVWCLVLAAPVWLIPSKLAIKWRAAVFGALVVLNASWWLPAVLNPNIGSSDAAGASAFALRSEAWGGPLLTALGLGGAWNAQVIPATRGLPWMPIAAVMLAALAVVGISPLVSRLGRATGWWLVGFAAVSLVLAVAGAWSPTAGAIRWIVESVPGGGIVRDGQKLLAPVALLMALAVPLGVARISDKSRARVQLRLAMVVLIVIPLALLPDMAAGVWGRLGSVAYPAGWESVRSAIAAGPPGDAISVPWTTFRRYPWNGNRTVLDPAPRFMPRTVIADDRLPVSGSSGVTWVGGDDPRSAAVAAGLGTNAPLVDVLPAMGVRWVIEQTDQPRPIDRSKLVGLRLVVNQTGLKLWEVPTAGPAPELPSWWPIVATVDLLGLVILLSSATLLVVARRFPRADGATSVQSH